MKTVFTYIFKGYCFQYFVFGAKGNALAGMSYHATVVAAIADHYTVFQGYVIFSAGIYLCICLAIGVSANTFGRTKKVGGKAYFAGHFSLEELQLIGI